MSAPSASTLSPRTLSALLSGYLCGTRSRLLADRVLPPRRPKVAPACLARAYAALATAPVGAVGPLATALWRPRGTDVGLRDALAGALATPGIIELVIFGSHAHATTTGFSDLDAILVIPDEAAEDPVALTDLRRRVLAAQRAVVAHQPMQHHGFEVTTPKLLVSMSESIGMPPVVFKHAKCLWGRVMLEMGSGANTTLHSQKAFSELTDRVAAIESWPRHAWSAHGLIAVFELLPVLYLQSRGVSIQKSESFDAAAEEFGRRWWPYRVLEDVRMGWPRLQRVELELAVRALRNPWDAIALWRRFPVPVPEPARPLLSARCLDGLKSLATEMRKRAR